MRLIDTPKPTQDAITTAAETAGEKKSDWLERVIAAALAGPSTPGPGDEVEQLLGRADDLAEAELLAAASGVSLADWARGIITDTLGHLTGRSVDSLAASEFIPTEGDWLWDGARHCYVNSTIGVDVRFHFERWAYRRNRAAAGLAGFNDWVHPLKNTTPSPLDSPHRWREALAAAEKIAQ